MKNHASRLLIVAGFVLAFVVGAASRSIPGATGVTVVAAQERHEAIADMRRAKDLLEQARALLAGAPGTFGGHRDKALKHLDAAIGEVHEAVETREHEHH
ncbi:MAG: hypothetical protein ACRD59_15750 [Candidatus Acidiferrales bacterium]